MRYIKWSEIYKIAAQLPDFIYYQSRDNELDSGYYFENMILPNFHQHQFLYTKDYEILRNLKYYTAS